MKAICFSLWGTAPRYTIGAIENLKLARAIYPGWVCRFYVGDTTPLCITDQLKGAEIIRMSGKPCDWTSTYWRFLAASDAAVDVMISRDCDSRLNLREKSAVEEWLKSDKDFHIMRDDVQGHWWKIMAGMWGVRNGLLSDMDELIENYKQPIGKNSDQRFLATVIYPRIRHSLMVHDEKTELRHLDPSRPFPVKIDNCVGDIIGEDTLKKRIHFL